MTNIIELAKSVQSDDSNKAQEIVILYPNELQQFASLLREEFIKELGEPVGEVKLDEYNLKYIHWNAHHWSHVLYGGTQLYALPKKG